MNFPCNACGTCCRRLPTASSLHSGDGVCRHLDLTTQRCSIYAQRPLVCRVDDLYQQRLATTLSPRIYYLLQAHACAGLDASNANLPRETAAMLARQGDGTLPAPLSEEEVTSGLRQIMAVSEPLLEQT